MNENAALLAKRASCGDAEAFGRLYELYACELYRFALWFLRSGSFAQDAVQEAMLGAFKGISGLKKPEDIKAWMFTILANTCKKMLREASAAGESLNIDDLPEIPDGDSLSPSCEISAALAKLSDDERSVVLLGVIGGYKSREIARILGCAPGTVRSKLSRSLEKLRKELK